MPTFATLRRYNLAAGVLHTLSAVAVVALSNDFALPVNANYMAGPPGTSDRQMVDLLQIRMSWLIGAFFVLSALAHFGTADVFGSVLVPWGAACTSFVTYPAGLAEKAPKNAVFLGPTEVSVNLWFPRDAVSLGIPMDIARRMAEEVPESFIRKKPGMAYPERRVYLK